VYLNKGYDSVPSQPADPANFSLIDLINSLADPGPGGRELCLDFGLMFSQPPPHNTLPTSLKLFFFEPKMDSRL
jgi:hypothetical protein